MRERSPGTRWTRHFVYRTEHFRTTWKFRLAVVVLVGAGLWLTSGWWTVAVGRSLVCDAGTAPSDAILIENFEPDYLLFDRAARLRRAGIASRVFVPIQTDAGTGEPGAVPLAIVDMMAKMARLGTIDVVPVPVVEPITLNSARQVRRSLEREGIRSVVVVTPLFRSRRTALVYNATFAGGGIMVRCEPVQGPRAVNTWFRTWHGIQDVAEQWIKLQYYRAYVLPFRARTD
jgi:hypothetical protein